MLVSREGSVAELAFREGIMDRIRARDPRFHERAYLFVLAPRVFPAAASRAAAISGRELVEACRDLALDRTASWPRWS